MVVSINGNNYKSLLNLVAAETKIKDILCYYR